MKKIFEVEAKEVDGSLHFYLNIVVEGKKMCIVEANTDKEIMDFVSNIKKELDGVLSLVDRMVKEYETNSNSEDETLDPKKLWEKMESMDDSEVISFFNSLPEDIRKSLSSYVFASVNMFKGKGLIFSTYFNHETSLLEVG